MFIEICNLHGISLEWWNLASVSKAIYALTKPIVERVEVFRYGNSESNEGVRI